MEPVHTSGYVHIPHLRKKLKLLYGYHSLIDVQYKLAQALGVAPSTLATWLNGTQFKDDRTWRRSIRTVAAVYGSTSFHSQRKLRPDKIDTASEGGHAGGFHIADVGLNEFSSPIERRIMTITLT